MTALTTAWLALLADPHALLETALIVGITSITAIGFLAGPVSYTHLTLPTTPYV